jgi:transposase
MIQLQRDTRILLATHPVDFRKGIDGLAAVCRVELNKEPRSGTYFVFINQSGTMIRVLAYDGTGFWLMTKRLSQGRFRGWPTCSSNVDAVEAKHLRALLSGGEFSALESAA